MSRILIILLLTLNACFAQEGVKYSTFEGGMLGYSKIILKLKYNKDYEYDEWSQAGKRIIDKGTWIFDDSSSTVILDSDKNQVSKNYYYNSAKGRSLLFRSDTFEISDGMIYLFDRAEVDAIPEDETRDSRTEYYSYRVLYRVMPIRREELVLEEEPDAFSAYIDATGDEPEDDKEPELFVEKMLNKLKNFMALFKEEKPVHKRKR